MLTPQEQLKIIKKGAFLIVDEKELLEKLEKKISLTVKLGLDPSAPDIHVGHAVVLRKMKQLQDLGHQIVILIGDFTGKIGDPTGKSKGRVALSDEEVKKNAKTYCDQIFKILNQEKTKVVFNSSWLSKLTFSDVISLASKTTVARMMERDDFKKRFDNNVPIGVHEFFYPIMQAYDSVHLKADIELGGTDQTFNILMGRTLQKSMGQEQQIAIFMPILEGLDGVEKMSKSLGNYIGINEPSQVVFKKVMEVPDQLIIKYYELATDVHPDQIEAIKTRLQEGENPKNIKMELAKIITGLYNSQEEVEKAMEYYNTAFSKKGIPTDIPQIKVNKGLIFRDVLDILLKEGFIPSKSEFNRLVAQGGVQLNQEKITKDELLKEIKNGDVLKIGKKKFVKFEN